MEEKEEAWICLFVPWGSGQPSCKKSNQLEITEPIQPRGGVWRTSASTDTAKSLYPPTSHGAGSWWKCIFHSHQAIPADIRGARDEPFPVSPARIATPSTNKRCFQPRGWGSPLLQQQNTDTAVKPSNGFGGNFCYEAPSRSHIWVTKRSQCLNESEEKADFPLPKSQWNKCWNQALY